MLELFLKKFSDFAMVFVGLMIGSIPFVVIGVIASTLIARFVKSSQILKYKSKNPILSHIQVMFFGLFLPVCECGNIPLAKRLSLIGFAPSEVITFVLAAPIFNPIVLVSTLVAFNLDYNIAIIRVLAGGLIALVVGLVFFVHSGDYALHNNIESATDSNTSPKKSFSFEESILPKNDELAVHTNSLIENFAQEFVSVLKMLIIGCMIASIFQIVIPRDLVAAIGISPTLSVIALMALAFVVSLCSSIDAFFALSFVGSFNLGAIVAFLVFGPMIDIKSLSMLSTIFPKRTLIMRTLIVSLLCLGTGLSVNYFYKINYI